MAAVPSLMGCWRVQGWQHASAPPRTPLPPFLMQATSPGPAQCPSSPCAGAGGQVEESLRAFLISLLQEGQEAPWAGAQPLLATPYLSTLDSVSLQTWHTLRRGSRCRGKQRHLWRRHRLQCQDRRWVSPCPVLGSWAMEEWAVPAISVLPAGNGVAVVHRGLLPAAPWPPCPVPPPVTLLSGPRRAHAGWGGD